MVSVNPLLPSQNILNFIKADDFDAFFPDAMRFTRIKSAVK